MTMITTMMIIMIMIITTTIVMMTKMMMTAIISGVTKGVSGVKTPDCLKEKEIFNVEMLHCSFVTHITMFTITKYININLKPPIINSWLSHRLL